MPAISIPNTFLPSTTISSTAMNANFTAVADAIENSLALDGTDAMSAPLLLSAGNAAAPGLAFDGDTNLGIYRKAADSLGFATAGVERAFFDSSGNLTLAQALTVTGALTVSGAVTIPNDSISYAEIQNVSATSRILGRSTVGAGDIEECTLTQVLDFIGSAAQGDILYRGAASWARLGAGTAGQVLTSGGAAANVAWGNGRIVQRAYTSATSFTTSSTIPDDNTIPQSGEGGSLLSLSFTPTNAANRIRVCVSAALQAESGTEETITMALFNAAGSAIAVNGSAPRESDVAVSISLIHEYVAGGTSAQTISVRAGAVTADCSLHTWGAIPAAAMTVEEIVP